MNDIPLKSKSSINVTALYSFFEDLRENEFANKCLNFKIDCLKFSIIIQFIGSKMEDLSQ